MIDELCDLFSTGMWNRELPSIPCCAKRREKIGHCPAHRRKTAETLAGCSEGCCKKNVNFGLPRRPSLRGNEGVTSRSKNVSALRSPSADAEYRGFVRCLLGNATENIILYGHSRTNSPNGFHLRMRHSRAAISQVETRFCMSCDTPRDGC